MSVLEVFKTLDYGPAPESPEAVNAWLEEHGRRFGLFINNRWVTPENAEYTLSYNPATGEKLAETVQAGKTEVDDAIRAARGAFETWSRTPGVVRARYLYAIARNIQKHHRLMAVLESMDNGKPIRESRDIDVPLLARHFYYYAGWARLMESELKDYQPVGVVGQIIPWNFPLLMLAWKIAPAIAMGNTVVLKPASYTRLTALLFAEVVAEAGCRVSTSSLAAARRLMIVTHRMSTDRLKQASLAASCAARQPARARSSRSSWAASHPLSSSKTLTWMGR
jgi:aldehyde dehydrogenase (NAD+)